MLFKLLALAFFINGIKTFHIKAYQTIFDTTALASINSFHRKMSGLYASSIDPKGSRTPSDRPLSWTRYGDESSGTIIDYNWKYGMCQHHVPFEGAQIIRRFKFCGDLMSFSFIDGKICLIRLSNGAVLDKFNEHNGEVTSIDFDGLHLCSGGQDGTLCFYSLTYDQPTKFGNYLHKFPQLYSRAVTGIKIMTIRTRGGPSADISMNSKNETVLVASCSLDRKLSCIDFESGKIVYEVQLASVPLCMDYKDGYLAVGTSDGKVYFFKGATGAQLLFFQTQSNKVRSVHLSSSEVLFTGGDDGRVTRWDISGKNGNRDVPLDMAEHKLLSAMAVRPTRFIDYYFFEAKTHQIANHYGLTDNRRDSSGKLPWAHSNKGVTMVYQEEDRTSGVVSLQGDDDKLVVAYQDGIVSCWETVTGFKLFDLKGRSRAISTVQYDSTRLVADGTFSAVVLHDFSESPSVHEASSDELLLKINSFKESQDDSDMWDELKENPLDPQ